MIIGQREPLEEKVNRELGHKPKLDVRVISDDSVYTRVALNLFTNGIMEAKPIDTQNEMLNPDIILIDITSDINSLYSRLKLMKDIGSKFSCAALVGTMDTRLYTTLFTDVQRDETYLRLWDEITDRITKGKNSITEAYGFSYPSNGRLKDSEDLLNIGLRQLKNKVFCPPVLDMLLKNKIDRQICKLFATDLDGSLLNDNGEVNYSNRGALTDLGEQMPIVYCSGRAPTSVYSIAEKMDTRKEWYVIAYNGALALNRFHDKMYEQPMTYETTSALLEAFESIRRKKNFDGNVLLNYFHGDTLLSVDDPKVADLREGYVAKNHGRVEYGFLENVSALEHYTKDQSPHKILVIIRAGINDAITGFREVINSVDELRTDISGYNSQPNYFEFSHPEATKGNALSKIADGLGIYLSNVAYLGNEGNDLSALVLVGNSFTVENASEELDQMLKSTGHLDRIQRVSSNNSNCVEDVVKKMEARGVYKRPM